MNREINPYLEIETSVGIIPSEALDRLWKLGNVVSDELTHSNDFRFYSLAQGEAERIKNYFSHKRGYASKLEEMNASFNVIISRRIN